MKNVAIEQPHGYMMDLEGRIVKRFARFKIKQHKVPDEVEKVEYVDSPTAHEQTVHWMYSSGVPPVTIALSQQSVKNNGTDSVDVILSLDSDGEQPRDMSLSIDGSDFSKSVSPDSDTVQTITSTKSSGSTIQISVDGDEVQGATAEIEVVEA